MSVKKIGAGLVPHHGHQHRRLFVETLAAPAADEKTSLTVMIGGHARSLMGRVAYVVPHIGFALQFEAVPEDQERLSHLLETLE